MQIDRPWMPSSYGVADGAGPLVWGEICQRLESARNYWIGSSGTGGAPHSVPVWGVWLENSLCFGTASESVKARNLSACSACSLHLESGDEPVMLEGQALPLEGDLLERADALYKAKYGLGLRDSPGDLSFFRVAPGRAMAWREQDFPASATRWTFS